MDKEIKKPTEDTQHKKNILPSPPPPPQTLENSSRNDEGTDPATV